MSVNYNKVPMRQQDEKERIKNFDEVPLGYSGEEALAEANRCLQCKNKPCVSGCPVGIEIPSFIKAVREGDIKKAYEIITDSDTIPAVTGRVCPQESQCQAQCVVGKKGDPVGIGNIERFVADWNIKNQACEIKQSETKKGIKIAIVGSGPASLACASDLSKWGYDVDVYEGFHKYGGVLSYGIPEFRLPKSIVAHEIECLTKLGVNFHNNVLIGRSKTISELFEEGYKAIFVGTGAGLPKFMNIDGENLSGVYSANEFLTRVNLMKAYLFPEYDTPVKKGNNVAVIGGGNVAMDSARTAKRLGAKNVYIIYRRTENEMPARAEEIERAKEEGIIFHVLTNPIKYIGDENGHVKEVECNRMELGEEDASGRAKPKVIKGSEFKIDIDEVIVAIGTNPNPIIERTTKGLEFDKNGHILIEDNGETSVKGIFAGGDVVTGSATVITAMGAGKKAAKSINEYINKL